MKEFIYGQEDGKNPCAKVLGWRVFLTQSVVDSCVAVPQGVEGQTVGSRIRDLVAFLEFHLKQAPELGHGKVNWGFSFCISVVNDNRSRSEYGDGLEMPGTAIPLSVLASIDRGGVPTLIVMHSDEDLPD